MSLRGRYVIDRIKAAVSHRLTLPCPPYGSPLYWDKVYKTLGPDDAFEWGDLRFHEDLAQHRYDPRRYASHVAKLGYATSGSSSSTVEQESDGDERHWVSTTFGEAVGLSSSDRRRRDDRTRTMTDVLTLGCGNSRLGEDLVEGDQWYDDDNDIDDVAPGLRVTQVDICDKVLESMAARCAPHVEAGRMRFVRDDATILATLEDDTVDAAVDKGLVDALFCADCHEQIGHVLHNVHRVLRPGAVFLVFSFSRPEFVLPHLTDMVRHDQRHKLHTMWSNVQIRALDSILLYRFQKRKEAATTTSSSRRHHTPTTTTTPTATSSQRRKTRRIANQRHRRQ